MKTKLEIIEETAAYYMEDPSRRALLVSTRKCLYYTPDGKVCAVGRYLISPERAPNGSIGRLLDRNEITEEDFIESVRGHDGIFWGNLQEFHDAMDLWDDKGLTIEGVDFLNQLKQKYATDK